MSLILPSSGDSPASVLLPPEIVSRPSQCLLMGMGLTSMNGTAVGSACQSQADAAEAFTMMPHGVTSTSSCMCSLPNCNVSNVDIPSESLFHTTLDHLKTIESEEFRDHSWLPTSRSMMMFGGRNYMSSATASGLQGECSVSQDVSSIDITRQSVSEIAAAAPAPGLKNQESWAAQSNVITTRQFPTVLAPGLTSIHQGLPKCPAHSNVDDVRVCKSHEHSGCEFACAELPAIANSSSPLSSDSLLPLAFLGASTPPRYAQCHLRSSSPTNCSQTFLPCCPSTVADCGRLPASAEVRLAQWLDDVSHLPPFMQDFLCRQIPSILPVLSLSTGCAELVPASSCSHSLAASSSSSTQRAAPLQIAGPKGHEHYPFFCAYGSDAEDRNLNKKREISEVQQRNSPLELTSSSWNSNNTENLMIADSICVQCQTVDVSPSSPRRREKLIKRSPLEAIQHSSSLAKSTGLQFPSFTDISPLRVASFDYHDQVSLSAASQQVLPINDDAPKRRRKRKREPKIEGEPPSFQCTIEAGIMESKDGADFRIYSQYVAFFDSEVKVFKAHLHKHTASELLFKTADIARRLLCSPSMLAMYFKRHKHKPNSGIFQALNILHREPGRSDIKVGSYFATLQACLGFENYLKNRPWQIPKITWMPHGQP